MKIYSMTATFGKLEHQTLTLKPGLNIIEAPNEWGKSTWCAFLTVMLYGIDTRARSTASNLADKEKYAPWSGLPMQGSMKINWKGRDITIQRTTKGRVPMGVFHAFETESGLEVPELTASNCGQMLLGVERSVFLRAGFLKLSDLPVTQDEALRYRLNALVTTGDESATGVLLEQKLKELKNKCQHNQTGLLPKAREQLKNAEASLKDLQELSLQADACLSKSQELDAYLKQLKNHQAHIAYFDAMADAEQVTDAQEALNQAKLQADVCEYTCRELPSREEAEETIQTIHDLQQKWLALHSESRNLPPIPEMPPAPASFGQLPPEKAMEAARRDSAEYQMLRKKGGRFFPVLLAVILLASVISGFILYRVGVDFVWSGAIGGTLLLAAVVAYVISGAKNYRNAQEADELARKYGDRNNRNWILTAENYARSMAHYYTMLDEAKSSRREIDEELAELDRQASELTNGQELQLCLAQWQQVLTSWDAYEDARQNSLRLERQLQAISSVVRTPDMPKDPDELSYTKEQTAHLIGECQLQQRQQQQLLGQYLGKMDAIGSEDALNQQISALKARIAKLEQMNNALEIAQNALSQATGELQRRFAPRITARAQEIFQALTGGRYNQLRFHADFSLSSAAVGEDTLHSSLWRSDGTGDQMYLSLRLAVAEVLTPDAPLILDDALVRFDDDRLLAALKILEEESRDKQVIVFTCQSREKELWNSRK